MLFRLVTAAINSLHPIPLSAREPFHGKDVKTKAPTEEKQNGSKRTGSSYGYTDASSQMSNPLEKRVSQNETRELRRKEAQRKSMPVRTKVTDMLEYHDVTTPVPHVANAQVNAYSDLRLLRSRTTLTGDFSTTQHAA